MKIEDILSHLFTAVGTGGLVQGMNYLLQRRKTNAEAEQIDAENNAKVYDSWRQAFIDVNEEYQKLHKELIEIRRKMAELERRLIDFERENRTLREENERLKGK
jgi:septal ring factor EnvC (AmiA/AmiB activator)